MLKANLAGSIHEIPLARFRPSMAKFNNERATALLSGRWEVASMVVSRGSHERTV